MPEIAELRALTDAVPEILFTARPDGRWDYVNRRFTESTGLSQAVGLEEGWVRALDPADARRVLDRWRAAIAQGQAFEMRFRVRVSDGRSRWFLGRAQPVLDRADKRARWAGTWTEIDQLQRAKAAFQRREQRLATALEGSPVMVFGQDRALRYTWVHNPLGGFSAEAMLGKCDADLAPHSDGLALLEHLKRRVMEEGLRLRQAVPLRQGGETRYCDFTIDPEEQNGRVVGITGAAVDNTDRVRVEKRLGELTTRLAQEHQRKDQFFALLGHELRNALAPIRNAVHLLQARAHLTESELRKTMELVDRQVSRLAKIVDELLDLGRIASGRLACGRTSLSLTDVIRSAVETAEGSIQAHGHQLHLRLPAQPLRLDGDPARLSQAVVNLLQNAAKYSKDPSVITLTLERVGSQALIKVRDKGVGITKDMLPQLFELFAQADRSLARSEGGLGVGLALVRAVAEAHGGHAEAHSDGAGQGSEFVIRLPLPAAMPSSQRSASVAEEADVRTRARRLLVVDDNVDVAQSFAALLRALGHEAMAVYCGADALAAVGSFQPEVVFLDIGLPEMDGYEVARRIRARCPQGAPVLVAVSGYGQEEHLRRSRQSGFDEHLLKPVDIKDIKKLLSSLAVASG